MTSRRRSDRHHRKRHRRFERHEPGRFLLEHLYELGRAKADGIDIRGYFYWSLLDNFEWASGFCPRFGLHSVDRATGVRTARPSVRIYERVARTGKVTKADIASQPPYGAPLYCD